MKIVNVTEVIETRECCIGYEEVEEEGYRCLPAANVTIDGPCKGYICNVTDAECFVFRKCCQKVAVMMFEGSILAECNPSNVLETVKSLSRLGSCNPDPCLEAECPGFNKTEVLCFTNGCNCQPKWIHIKTRSEVYCKLPDQDGGYNQVEPPVETET